MTKTLNMKGMLVLLLLFLTAVVLTPRALAQEPPQEPPADGRFGAIESFWAPQEAAELGVGWERILFYWNEIQPTGPEDWNTLHVLEEWLVEAEEHDRQVLGLLKNTPAWATDGAPFSGVPRGLYLEIDDPDNLWANYVRRVVTYYAARGVHNWVIWNEPEIAEGVYGHEFAGELDDYVRLLEVAYRVAKETDPQAVIHLAGYSFWHDPAFLGEFFEAVTAVPGAAENNYFFDILSLHIYFRVETVWDLVQQTDALQNEYGLDKPIWINETNAAPNLDPWWPVERPSFQVDLDQQAWYLIQAYALGFAGGADSIGVYKLIDILLPEGGESFGILRPDYSRRPAYLAYKTTIELLRGFEGVPEREQTADYTVVTFSRPGEVVRVLWARRDTALEVLVPALASSAMLVDFTGGRQALEAADGAYALALDGARCRDACEIGGPPVFLVEEVADTAVPAAISATPVRLTLTPTPEIAATFTPWPTHTPAPSPTPTSTPTATPTATTAPSSTPSPLPSATLTQVATATPPPATAVPLLPGGTGDHGSSTLIAAWMPWSAALIILLLLALRVRQRPRL